MMLKKLDEFIKGNLQGMADKPFEANKAAVLDEYARQLIGKADDVIVETRKKVEQKLLEQEHIEQLL